MPHWRRQQIPATEQAPEADSDPVQADDMDPTVSLQTDVDNQAQGVSDMGLSE